MKHLIRSIFFLLVAATIAPAHAALNVFATVPEWHALANELGGDKVNVYLASNALQDPHRVEAKPSLIARMRSADLVVATGAELELGWLPVLLRESGNAKIQAGNPGYFEATEHVRMLEVPVRLDRADGDMHPFGNPHIQMSPYNIARVAEPLSKRFAELDPANASYYQSRYANFSERWNKAIKKWDTDAAPLKGMPIVVHHPEYIYLVEWLGMKQIATLEAKPGVEPSVSHLGEVLSQLQRTPAKAVIRSAYLSDRPSKWIVERTKVIPVVLPFSVGGSPEAKDLFGLFDDTIARLLAANK